MINKWYDICNIIQQKLRSTLKVQIQKKGLNCLYQIPNENSLTVVVIVW